MLVLVLDPAQHVRGAAEIGPVFDHEKLDAYRLSIEFVARVGAILDCVPRTGRTSAMKHLDEASTSVALNIAEGNGKRSIPDRVRFLEIARGSALECAACLDVLVVRKKIDREAATTEKATLVRIVAMLTKLIERLLGQTSTSTGASTSTTRRTNGSSSPSGASR